MGQNMERKRKSRNIIIIVLLKFKYVFVCIGDLQLFKKTIVVYFKILHSLLFFVSSVM